MKSAQSRWYSSIISGRSADLQSAQVIRVNVNTMIKVSHSVFPAQQLSSAKKTDEYQLMCSWLEATCEGSSEPRSRAATHHAGSGKKTQQNTGVITERSALVFFCFLKKKISSVVRTDTLTLGLGKKIYSCANLKIKSSDS